MSDAERLVSTLVGVVAKARRELAACSLQLAQLSTRLHDNAVASNTPGWADERREILRQLGTALDLSTYWSGQIDAITEAQRHQRD